jgi:hypothetical protein
MPLGLSASRPVASGRPGRSASWWRRGRRTHGPGHSAASRLLRARPIPLSPRPALKMGSPTLVDAVSHLLGCSKGACATARDDPLGGPRGLS